MLTYHLTTSATLALMYGAVLPEPSESFFDVLEKYADFKTSGYGATDHRLRVRLKKCKNDLLEALDEYKLTKQPVQKITRRDANAYRDTLLARMSPNSVARYKNTLNAALNWYIKETGIEWTSPFSGLLIKGAGASRADRLPLTEEHLEILAPAFRDSDVAWPLYVILRDTGARVAEVAGLRVQDCNIGERFIHITPTPLRRLKNAPSERFVPLSKEATEVLSRLVRNKGKGDPIFPRYAKERGMDSCC